MVTITPIKESSPWSILIGIACILAIMFFIDIEALKNWVAESGAWAPLAFIALKMLTIVIAPLSGGPLYPLAGLLFGFKSGFLYAVFGDLLGFTTAFYISRWFGRAFAQRFMSENEDATISKILAQIETPQGLFKTSYMFISSPEILSYACGLTRISYIAFISILMPLWTLVSGLVVLLGAQFGEHTKLLGLAAPLIAGVLFLTGIYMINRKKVDTPQSNSQT